MAMMRPSIVVTAAPAVMMPATAAMAAPMSMTVAALNLDNSVGVAESIRRCGGQRGRGSDHGKTADCS